MVMKPQEYLQFPVLAAFAPCAIPDAMTGFMA